MSRCFGWGDEKFTQTRPSWSITWSVGSVKRMSKLQKSKHYIFTILVLRILPENLEMNQNKITHASRVSRILLLSRACGWVPENKPIDINKQHITIAAEAALEERFQSERVRSLFYRNFLRMSPRLEPSFSKVVKSLKWNLHQAARIVISYVESPVKFRIEGEALVLTQITWEDRRKRRWLERAEKWGDPNKHEQRSGLESNETMLPRRRNWTKILLECREIHTNALNAWKKNYKDNATLSVQCTHILLHVILEIHQDLDSSNTTMSLMKMSDAMRLSWKPVYSWNAVLEFEQEVFSGGQSAGLAQ